jgi:hypothetical protein
MSDELVYHGTDSASAASIVQRGLNKRACRKAAGTAGVDDKGFSVTTDRTIAEAWAQARAAERGGQPVVLQAPRDVLALRQPDLTNLGDPGESYIDPADFATVGPSVFEPAPTV